MGLAKIIANCFVVALQDLGVQMPPQSLLDVDDLSLDYLRRLRASAGLQPKASRVPPLVPTFKKKIRIKPTKQTSNFNLYQKTLQQLHADLPKGAKLLAIAPLNSSDNGGGSTAVVPDPIAMVPDSQCGVVGGDNSLSEAGNDSSFDNPCNMVQTWGIPWEPLEFVEQAAKAKHPMQLEQWLPARLRNVVQCESFTGPQDLGSGSIEQRSWLLRSQLFINICIRMLSPC